MEYPRRVRFVIMLAMVSAVSACAAERARGPLIIPLGISVAETTRALRTFDFCAGDPGSTAERMFPRCDRPGLDRADAWVVARYRGDELIGLRRFERWADPAAARARWDQLVARWSERSPPSSGAREQLINRRQMPSGVQAWVAFSDGRQLVAIYLLAPTTATEPALLEEIVPAIE